MSDEQEPTHVGRDHILGYGFDPQPNATKPGICRGKCRGTERFRGDSPAKFGTTQDGKRTVWCPCCNTQLRRARPGESGLSDGAQLALIEGAAAKGTVMVDQFCKYDVVVLKELVAS